MSHKLNIRTHMHVMYKYAFITFCPGLNLKSIFDNIKTIFDDLYNAKHGDEVIKNVKLNGFQEHDERITK